MNDSVGVVAHLHGGKVHADSDGWPLHPASFENNPFGFPSCRSYHYPNDQRATMLWFHDHGMDNTGLQVHAGLAGLYFIRDTSDAELFQLIGSQEQEIPLVIQDRWLVAESREINYGKGILLNSTEDGYDRPEFLGETIFVNGRPTPHTHVKPLIYRLRVLNGSNARTYALMFANLAANSHCKVWYNDLITVIGNEAGLFAQPESLEASQYILLAPGERLDLLLDLSGCDLHMAKALTLVNLAFKAALNPDGSEKRLEPIFKTDADSVFQPADLNDLSILKTCPQSMIMQFRLKGADSMPEMAGTHGGARNVLNQTKLGQILARHADDEGFHWNADHQLAPHKRSPEIAKNRLILLMNGSTPDTYNPLTGGPWRDTQIWEMQPAAGDAKSAETFTLPFDAQLQSPALAGNVSSTAIAYQVSRAWFFEPEEAQPPHTPTTADPLWATITDNQTPNGDTPTYHYGQLYRDRPSLSRSIIKPVEGTYERWYVANIGSSQPVGDDHPDMHPFHMHLVNFVVTRRFVLQEINNQPGRFAFVERTAGNNAEPLSPNFDGKVRHDTVRIQSSELVELLVYFPRGYTGRYPYHCHLVEHEDMGMMLHFEVQSTGA